MNVPKLMREAMVARKQQLAQAQAQAMPASAHPERAMKQASQDKSKTQPRAGFGGKASPPKVA